MSLQSVVRCGAIATLVLLAGSACQPAIEESPTTEGETAPTETPPTAEEETPTAAEPAEPAPEATTPEAEAPTESAPEASAPATTPQQSCSAGAFVVDTDPAGLNVRSGPGSDFAVQGTLPTSEPVEVSIVGATGSWFLINEAYSGAQQELTQPGWVYAPLLGVTTTSLDINDPNAPSTLYDAPDGSAAVKETIPMNSEVTLLGCSGSWLEVQAGDTAGWLAVGEQCSNPVSTCP